MNYARVQIGGRLTRDPQLKYLGDGQTPCCEFGVCVNEKYKDKEKAHFFECVAWGKQGEVIAQHFEKGKPIFFDGRPEYQEWEKDGQKRSAIKMVVNHFEFVGAKTVSDVAHGEEYPRSRQTVGAGARQKPEGAFSGEPLDQDIPF
jgi:single-strand DNA-binding protein